MKDENSVPAAQKMTDVSLSIFRSKFKKTRIQMIDYSLNKLAATPPRRKAALIRSLLPGIETALRCGHGLKEIWVALEGEGLQMSYRVFHKTVSRSRNAKKPTAPSSWGNRINLSRRKSRGEQKWRQVKSGTHLR